MDGSNNLASGPATADENVKYSSKVGMYMILIGFSLGSSDIWRFSFLVFRNGGGAFLIPFLITLLLCGVPLYYLEFSISKFSGKGPYKIWDICPLFRGAGPAVCIAYMIYLCGNSIMACWMFDLLRHAFNDPLPWANCDNAWNSPSCRKLLSLGDLAVNNTLLGNATGILNSTSGFDYGNGSNSSLSNEVPMTAAEEFWQFQILELSPDISVLEPIQWRYMITMAVLRVLVCAFIFKSTKWIEKVMYFTTTIPVILIVAIFIRSMTLPGWTEGIYHFFYPDFSKLLNARIWIEASLMVFYTLAFGWGVLISMGSHASFKDNSLRTAFIVPILDGMVAIFTGMVSFAVLGNMAHTYGVAVPEILNAGMTAGIVSYVTALVSFPLPQIWSVFFFSSNIITSIDGQMIPLDMTVEVIGEMFPGLYPRFRAHVLVGLSVGLLVCAIPMCTGAGAYIFLWVDWYSAVWIGPCVAFIEVVVVGWVYGLDRFSQDMCLMSGQPLPVLLRYMLAFVSPFIVLVLFVTSCVEYVPPQYGSYTYPFTAQILGWLSVAIVLLPLISHAVYIVWRSPGSVGKRIRKQLRTMDTWGPCDAGVAEEYRAGKSKYDNLTMRDMLLYNVRGRAVYHRNRPQELVQLNPRESHTNC